MRAARATRLARDGGGSDAVEIDGARGLAAVADAVGDDSSGAASRACRAWLTAAAQASGDRMAAGLIAAEAAMASKGHVVSFAAVTVVGEVVEIAHAGGVRVYLLRRGSRAPESVAPRWAPNVTLPSGATLCALTADHGTVASMVEQGLIDRAAGRSHALRARLTRALGAGAQAERRRIALAPGDRILLASNGLWERVDDDRLAAALDRANDPESACTAVLDALGRTPGDDATVATLFLPDAPVRAIAAPAPATPARTPTPLLDRLGRDLTAAAREGRIDPVVRRDAELGRLQVAILSRRKPNAILVGEPGVGKTCLVEALAAAATAPGTSPELASLRVVELPASSLISGTRLRGELEARVESLLAEAEAAAPHLVLFFDEIHVLLGAGGEGGVDLADALKPALSRGRLRMIGATTPTELERLARDGALLRRFEVIAVDEPSPEEARQMLAAMRPRLETHFAAPFLDEALVAAVELTNRHIADRRLPDKAIDVLEHAGARRMLAGSRNPIGRAEVAAAVAERLGVPPDAIAPDAEGRRNRIRHGLAAELVGQDTAIEHIVAALDAADRASHRGPRASILLVGPTGVGKTEAARLLAEALFGPGRLVRFDLGEYGDEHQVARLLGAPPGYVGHDRPGALVAALRSRPGAVVLFDELEKAHPSVWSVLLALLDEGRITDGGGRIAHLGETVVVMTSNLHADRLGPTRTPGFARAAAQQAPFDDVALRALLRTHLPPELIGRIGAVVALGSPDAKARAELVRRRLARHAAGRGGVSAKALEGIPAELAERTADFATSPRELARLVDELALLRLVGIGTLDTLRPESRRVVSLVVAPRFATDELIRAAAIARIDVLASVPAGSGALAAVLGASEAIALARTLGGLVVLDRGRVRHHGNALGGPVIDRAIALASRLTGEDGAFLTDDAAATLPVADRERLVRAHDAELSVWRLP